MPIVDQIAHEIPFEPDKVVYVVNREVTKVVPLEELPKFLRGFEVPERDERGNLTMRYAVTAAVVTTYRGSQDQEVPEEEAEIVFLRYLDKDGVIINSPLTVVFPKK